MTQGKQIFAGLLILFLLNISCQKSSAKVTAVPSKEVKSTSDTIIKKSGIYLISPNQKDIDSLKKTMGEDQFYTVADDANFYISKIFSNSNQKISTLKYKKVDFKNENYVFNKNSEKNAWLILDYKAGSKPKTYSLADFYNLSDKKDASLQTVKSTGLDEYINNEDFFEKIFDINNDGKDDKIFSNKRNTGDNLIVFFNENNGYVLKLKSINFSEDGGNQISDIRKSKDGYEIITQFPDKGFLRRTYSVSLADNQFVLKKIKTESDSWQDDYRENCIQNLNFNLNKSIEELYKTLNETKENCSKIYGNRSKAKK